MYVYVYIKTHTNTQYLQKWLVKKAFSNVLLNGFSLYIHLVFCSI